MNEHIISIDNIKRFTNQCFDKDNDKVASIIKGILDGRSPRISDISNNMDGNPEANYKTIQRFLDKNDPRDNLHRLFNEDSPIVIGDPTEMEREQAKKTEYVGKIGEDKKLGFWFYLFHTEEELYLLTSSHTRLSFRRVTEEQKRQSVMRCHHVTLSIGES